MVELGAEEKGILKALAQLTDPAGCKVIGEKANISWRTVMAKLRGLSKEGYVQSPEKGTYIITAKGRKAVV